MIANTAMRVAPALSVTVIGKLALPVAGGTPVRTPAELRVSQEGWPATVHAYTPLPPVAASVCEYAVDRVAGGRGDAVAMASAAATGSVKVLDTLVPESSSTVALILKLPAAVGVPDRMPLPVAFVVRFSPAGKAPEDHVYTPVPPVAVSLAE